MVHAIRATGETDMGGGQMTEFDVSIKPAEGEPFQTTVKQSMLPAMLEEISEGQADHRQVRPGLAHHGDDLRLVEEKETRWAFSRA